MSRDPQETGSLLYGQGLACLLSSNLLQIRGLPATTHSHPSFPLRLAAGSLALISLLAAARKEHSVLLGVGSLLKHTGCGEFQCSRVQPESLACRSSPPGGNKLGFLREGLPHSGILLKSSEFLPRHSMPPKQKKKFLRPGVQSSILDAWPKVGWCLGLTWAGRGNRSIEVQNCRGRLGIS